jgi:methylated-DNA-[protein]-cysteine S-methyltransferase
MNTITYLQQEKAMLYSSRYDSPIGKLLLASKENNLIGLWFEGQKYFGASFHESMMIEKPDLPLFVTVKKWLDDYFSGKQPQISAMPLSPIGSDFRKAVWDNLCTIPYGKTITYGEIAKIMAAKMNKTSMSSQAIGGAVGHNPISIIIPCHRVVGANGNLTGYAGGIEKKIKLLELENAYNFSH